MRSWVPRCAFWHPVTTDTTLTSPSHWPDSDEPPGQISMTLTGSRVGDSIPGGLKFSTCSRRVQCRSLKGSTRLLLGPGASKCGRSGPLTKEWRQVTWRGFATALEASHARRDVLEADVSASRLSTTTAPESSSPPATATGTAPPNTAQSRRAGYEGSPSTIRNQTRRSPIDLSRSSLRRLRRSSSSNLVVSAAPFVAKSLANSSARRTCASDPKS